MQTLLTIIHVLVSVFMVLVILLQAGKSGGLSAFDSGGSVLGTRSSKTILSTITSWCAVIFMVTSLSLAYLSSRNTSVMSDAVKSAPPATAPAAAPTPAEVPAAAPSEQAPAEAPAAAPSEQAPAEAPAAAPSEQAPAEAPAAAPAAE